jgi:hypothetical protein
MIFTAVIALAFYQTVIAIARSEAQDINFWTVRSFCTSLEGNPGSPPAEENALDLLIRPACTNAGRADDIGGGGADAASHGHPVHLWRPTCHTAADQQEHATQGVPLVTSRLRLHFGSGTDWPSMSI